MGLGKAVKRVDKRTVKRWASPSVFSNAKPARKHAMNIKNMLLSTVLATSLLAVAHNAGAAETIAGDWQGYRTMVTKIPTDRTYNWEKNAWNFPAEKLPTSFDYKEDMKLSGTNGFMNIHATQRNVGDGKIIHKEMRKGSFDFPAKQFIFYWVGYPLVLTYTQEGAFEYLRGGLKNLPYTREKTNELIWEFRRPYNGVPLKDDGTKKLPYTPYKLDTMAVDFNFDWMTVRDDNAKTITSFSPDNAARVILKFTNYKEYDPLQENMVKEIFPPLFQGISDVKELETRHDVFRNGLGFRIVTYSANWRGQSVDITVEFAKTPTEDDAPTALLIRCVTQGETSYNSTIEKISQSLRRLPK